MTAPAPSGAPRRSPRGSAFRAAVPWPLIGRVAGEAVVAFGAAAIMVVLCGRVDVNPLDRVGQVSGLAAVQYRLALLGLLVVVAATVVVLRVRAMGRDTPTRQAVLGLACAAVAGLATGATAGGVEIALHGTDWGLNGLAGDAGTLIGWAKDAMAGRTLPSTYPPLAAHLIATVAQIGDLPAEYAMKWFQICTVAAVGPLAYLAWRLLLSPLWALVVGVTAALPLIDAYKPYTNLVLVILVPVLIRALMALRRAGEHGYWHAVVAGLVIGAALGILFEGYFGWFLWSLPAVAVSVLLFLPWRNLAALLRSAHSDGRVRRCVLRHYAPGPHRGADAGQHREGLVLLLRHRGAAFLLRALVRRPAPAEPGRLADAGRPGERRPVQRAAVRRARRGAGPGIPAGRRAAGRDAGRRCVAAALLHRAADVLDGNGAALSPHERADPLRLPGADRPGRDARGPEVDVVRRRLGGPAAVPGGHGGRDAGRGAVPVRIDRRRDGRRLPGARTTPRTGSWRTTRRHSGCWTGTAPRSRTCSARSVRRTRPSRRTRTA